MLFSSIPFLYYFLPCTLLLYFIVPKSLKNLVLLFASLFFYAWGEPKFLLIMLLSILLGYIYGILIETFNQPKYTSKKLSTLFLVLSLLTSIGTLAYYKYVDFFIKNTNALFGTSIALKKIALPIGISFYTFQILSYTIDVYRGHVKAQKNIISLATYIAFFPQLIAGPIVRYIDVEKQLKSRTQKIDQIAEGIRRFVLGLSKKVLLANPIGELATTAFASDHPSVSLYWLYAIAFTLQIYYDFSGYSDMAIGLGKIFGFDFLENFNYPYISKSITEFWRRWHISLGQWFRDYVYIPLGGNRVSSMKWLRNILIVWFLTGFWHGASWNFILWGLFYGLLLLLEKIFLGRFLQKTRIFKHIYVLFFVITGFVLFDAPSLSSLANTFQGMFCMQHIPLFNESCRYLFSRYLLLLFLGCIGATPLIKNIVLILKRRKTGEKICNLLETPVMLLLLIMVTAYLVDSSFNPFLYFRF